MTSKKATADLEEAVVPFADVKPWAKNPRQVKKKDYDRLRAQVLELGIYKRLLVVPDPDLYGFDFHGKADKFIIAGGNTRFRVIFDLGHSEVAITIRRPKDEAELLKLAMSDNDHVGEWDEQSLAEQIYKVRDSIKLADYKIDIAKPVGLESLLTSFGPDLDATPEDTVPDPEPQTDTQLGDIFNLGPHRLLCGDATAAWAYQALLGDERAGLVFTDPPYNVAYKGQKFGEIMNDDMAPEAFIDFSVAFMQRLHEFSREGAALYICSGYSSYPPFLYALKKAGMTFSCPIIWVKDNPTMGWEDYKKQHEMVLKARREKKRTATPILYAWNKGRHYFAADRFEADVWIMKKRAGETMLHPTQKPLSLVQRAIRNSSVKEDLVLDPFVGSGTTIIAAEREGRTARAMDLDPFNIDTTIRRYAALGGPGVKEIRATRSRVGLPAQAEATGT